MLKSNHASSFVSAKLVLFLSREFAQVVRPYRRCQCACGSPSDFLSSAASSQLLDLGTKMELSSARYYCGQHRFL